MTLIGTRRLQQLREGMAAAKRRAGRPSVSPATAATVLALIDELEAAHVRIARLERLDREAATHVETVICLRTHFTGSPPYVGWRGLGLALSEALDERDSLRARTTPEDVTQHNADGGAASASSQREDTTELNPLPIPREADNGK